jgi:hypothetical protein
LVRLRFGLAELDESAATAVDPPGPPMTIAETAAATGASPAEVVNAWRAALRIARAGERSSR